MFSFDFFSRAASGVLFAVGVMAPIVALADPGPLASATPVPEIGRISTSDRHDEPIGKTTRTTFVVDRAHIEARGERTVADALADVPGVELYRYGAFGAQANIFIRGASSTSVLILLDGVPVTPGSNEQLDLGTLSTAGVRKIEIVEGSGSTLYGSNAVGGVVNIITDVPRGTYLEASDGTLQDRDLRVGAGDGHLGASFERHIAQNDYAYPAAPVPGASPYAAGSRFNADAEQTAATVAYDANLAPDVTARLRLGSDEIHIGVPGELTFGATPYARENISRDNAHLDITHSGAHSATTLTLFGIHQDLDYVDPSSATENPTIDGRSQISLRHVIEGGASTLTVGLDLARESAVLGNIALYDTHFNVIGYSTTGETQAETALYAQEQYAFANGVQVSAGMRGENDAPLGSAATPSLGIGVPLGTGLRLVFNGGTAFRVPSIIDRYYPGFSNPNLKPERSKDADVTLASSTLLGGASLGFFLRDAANLIEVTSAAPENVARSSLRGLIGTIKTRPYNGFVSTLSVTDTYRAQDLSAGVPESRLFFTPVFVSKLGLERAFGNGAYTLGAQANIFGPHNESSPFTSTGQVVNPNGQTTIDVFLRGRLSRDTVVSVRAANIGDERYEPILGYPAPGRTIEFELSTR